MLGKFATNKLLIVGLVGSLLLLGPSARASVLVHVAIAGAEPTARSVILHVSWSVTGADHVYDYNTNSTTEAPYSPELFSFDPAVTGYPEPAFDPPADQTDFYQQCALPGGDTVFEVDFLTDWKQQRTALVSVPLHVDWDNLNSSIPITSGGSYDPAAGEVPVGDFTASSLVGADAMGQAEQDMMQWGYTSFGVASVVLLCFVAAWVALRWLSSKARSS